jgi:hypothetical protein
LPSTVIAQRKPLFFFVIDCPQSRALRNVFFRSAIQLGPFLVVVDVRGVPDHEAIYRTFCGKLGLLMRIVDLVSLDRRFDGLIGIGGHGIANQRGGALLDPNSMPLEQLGMRERLGMFEI